MARIPNGWKKTVENSDMECYAKKNYSIYIWKVKRPEAEFVVEPFRNLANYRRRLFKKGFRKPAEAKKFAWSLMKQKEIRAFYQTE